MSNITETVTNPPVALATGAVVVASNTFWDTLPYVINGIMVIYAILLVVHKAWQIYRDFKKDKQEDVTS